MVALHQVNVCNNDIIIKSPTSHRDSQLLEKLNFLRNSKLLITGCQFSCPNNEDVTIREKESYKRERERKREHK